MNKQETKFKQTEIGMIPEDWEKKNLGEEIELCYGKGLPKKNRIPGPYPVFGSNGIVGSHNEFLVEGPGIIIGRKGSVGEVKFSKNNFWPIDTTYYLKVKKKGSIDFWYYFLLTLKLNRMNSHSAVPGLNRDMVYELKKKIPDEKEQHRIAKILSDLDSKIELLQKQNETLEAIAQAIFKHWFVDFEFPNEEGKPYKSSGGEMVDSELGEISKGWVVKELGDFVDVQKGLSYKGKFLSEEGIPMSNLGTFKPLAGFKIDGLKHYTGEYKERHLVVPGDLIVANTDITQKRDVLGSPALIPQNIGSDRALFTHHIFAIRHKQNNLTNYFIYFLLQTPEYRSRAIGFATGTTVLALPKEAILNLLFAVAPENIITKFNDMAKFLFNKLELNNQQIQTLQKIRDSLLPKLMSGKIRVPVEVE